MTNLVITNNGLAADASLTNSHNIINLKIDLHAIPKQINQKQYILNLMQQINPVLKTQHKLIIKFFRFIL